MALKADYPPAVVVCSTSGTGMQPDILDISACVFEGYPPIITVYITATATVKIWGARSVSGGTTPTLVRAIDYSGGGFTTSDSYDLVPGINFYQVEVTANTGDVVVEAGLAPNRNGHMGLMQLLRMTTNATQGL